MSSLTTKKLMDQFPANGNIRWISKDVTGTKFKVLVSNIVSSLSDQTIVIAASKNTLVREAWVYQHAKQKFYRTDLETLADTLSAMKNNNIA